MDIGKTILAARAGEVAKAMYKALPKNNQVAHQDIALLLAHSRIAAWRCGDWFNGKWKFSGAVVIEGVCRSFAGKREEVTFRRLLRPGWTKERFLKAAALIYERIWHRTRLLCLQEYVQAKGELKGIAHNPEYLNKVDAEAVRERRPTSFDKMSEDDCFFWLSWMERLK